MAQQIKGTGAQVFSAGSEVVASPTVADIGTKKLTTMEQFGSLKAVNGWKIEPNGVITQWGLTTQAAAVAGTFYIVVYPIVFPNQMFATTVSNHNISAASIVVGMYPNSSGAFNVYWDTSGAQAANFMAIGD